MRWSVASTLLDAGFYLSYGPKTKQQEAAQESLIKTPLYRLFLETDKTEASLPDLYAWVARLKGISMEALTEQIYHNYTNIFTHGMARTNRIID
jgi:Tat protein secretion system quality control protein TatD with DNase activity